MFDFNDPSIVVQMCKFQAYIQKAHIVIKFPCSYFVQWKTINNRYSICTQKRVRTANDQAIFNQKLTFYTQMVYNTKKREYYSKQTFLLLNLVSKSRPDQVKLVGRISVDLADVLNRRRFEEVTRMKLNYCSVEGSIVFGIVLLNKRDSNLSVKDLDRSAFTYDFCYFSDYFSLNPINRMMIEESINGNYLGKNNNNNKGSDNLHLQKHDNHLANKQLKKQQQDREQEHFGSVPSFVNVNQQARKQNKGYQPKGYQKNKFSQKQYEPIDEEVISFQNSQKHERDDRFQRQQRDDQHQRQERLVSESPKTHHSREQSLIEKLEQKNFRGGQKEYQNGYGYQKEHYQKVGNVVDIANRQSRTDRVVSETVNHNNNNNNSGSNNTTNNNRSRGLNKVEQQTESGQIKRQQGVMNKVSSQQRLQSTPKLTQQPPTVAKPTSPASYQRHLIHVSSQSKFSQTSQYHNQQLLSIVQKLQQQKLQQQSMIQSLKGMLVNKSMKKKEGRNLSVEDVEQQNRFREMVEENVALRRENQMMVKEGRMKAQELVGKEQQLCNKEQQLCNKEQQLCNKEQQLINKEQQLSKRSQQLRQKNMHVYELLDKIKRLQIELAKYQQKIILYQDEIAELHMRQIQNQKICESLKLSLTMQPGYDNLVRGTNNNNIINKNNIVDNMNQQEQAMNILSKKSSKLLDTFKTNHNLFAGQVQEHYKQQDNLCRSQQAQQEFKIMITKDENIYQQIEKQNVQLSQRVKQLEQQIAIYKDLLKQQNQTHQIMKQSIPIITPQTITHLQAAEQQQIPYTITLSKNTNIYENYQNLQQENNQLYDKINQLDQQILSYKQLMKQEKDQSEEKRIQGEKNFMAESVEVQNIGEYHAAINSVRDVASSQPPVNHNPNHYHKQNQSFQQSRGNYQNHDEFQDNSPNYAFETTPSPKAPQQQQNMVAQTFKIILTKDKKIYKQQQQDNIELSKRVIQLQQQMEKYKELLNNQQQVGSKEGENNGATIQNELNYQQEGFRITLRKDKNIFQNQQKQLTQYQEQVKQLQETVQKYKQLYGPINNQPQYKVSITREQRIYDDQQEQIKQLLKSLQQKDQQVMELTTRLSFLERPLYEDKFDSGEIKISIKRDENIYDEQENDIRELMERIAGLEEKLRVIRDEVREKDGILEVMRKEINYLKSIEHTQANLTPKQSNLPLSTHTPSSPTHKKIQFIPVQLSCLACVSLQNRVLQLQIDIQLIQQQKTMLQEQLGALQQQKFCFTSTQNELKITIQDLRDEINLLGQENERLTEELQFVQENYHLEQNRRDVGNQKDGNNYYDEQYQHNDEHQYGGQVYKEVPQEVVNRSKFAMSLPQNVLNQYKQIHTQNQLRQAHQQSKRSQSPRSSTNHLQQLPQSPRSRESPKPQHHLSKQLISLQQQNTQLHHSLSTFQQQLQQQYLTIGELQQRIARLMHDKQMLFERDQELSKEIIVLSEKQQEVNQREIQFRVRISELERELTSMKVQSLSTISTSHVTRKDQGSDISSKMRISELENQVQGLRGELREVRQALLIEAEQMRVKQQQIQSHQQQTNLHQQLQQKQQQIQQLQQQLQSLNQSLTELSISYQSLQKSLIQLQQQKQSQTQSIRQQYQSMNKMLKDELESIESIIIEKQKMCQDNQGQLRERKGEIQQLVREVQIARGESCEVREFVQEQRRQVQEVRKQNQRLNSELLTIRQQLTHLQQQKPQNTLSQQQLNYKQKLLILLRELTLSKQQRDMEITHLLPIISIKLTQQQNFTSHHTEEQLAKTIAKQIQKIKINIMRNYQTAGGTQGVNQKTVPIKTVYNHQFKTFADKQAMLNYLKPIEDLVKGY